MEIQKGSDGYIWIMIHSGSRNLGKQVCDYYNKIAEELNTRWHSSVSKDWKLAFLPIDSEEGQAYLREMNYAVEFALANRKLMMDRIKECFLFEIIEAVENKEELLIFEQKHIDLTKKIYNITRSAEFPSHGLLYKSKISNNVNDFINFTGKMSPRTG